MIIIDLYGLFNNPRLTYYRCCNNKPFEKLTELESDIQLLCEKISIYGYRKITALY